MNLRETALSFACGQARLTGILSLPVAGEPTTGVLIVVGGPQYRAGSHRQFTLLCRALARAGHAAMRFDYRGMGDSGGELPGYMAIDEDIEAALAALQNACPSVRRIALWGLCDGASAALMYAQRRADPRIVGLVLANPWLQSEQAQAHAIVHSYYRQRFLDAAFWRKLLGGGINPWQKIREYFQHKQQASVVEADDESEVSRILAALNQLVVPALFLLCQRDGTAQAFLAQLALANCKVLQGENVKRVDFAEADHTFSCEAWRAEVESVTIDWLNAGAGYF